MVLALRGMIGRGMARTAGQVAMSVLATLIATSLYSELRRGYHEVTAAPAPAPLTSGGKYGARIAGAEMPSLPESARPLLSVVNWALSPPVVVATVPDPGSLALTPPPVEATPPAESHPLRRVARKTVAAVTPLPPRPTSVPPVSAPVPLAPAPSADGPRPGLLASASATVGDTAHSVVELGGSALAAGGQAVSHLVPWLR